LPFLATPLHHHFDLLGWDRRRLVYGAWAIGAGFAILGVASFFATETWERYLCRILIFIFAAIIWSSGSWSRKYFVGKHPAERTHRRRLALYYGYPYRLMGISLYHLVEIIDANEDVIETPAEELALWHRMSIFDARAMLGLYCYRAGYYPAALAQWTRIPESNRKLRPSIQHLLEELNSRLALEEQETQPMRIDQILRQQPVITGSLRPADLPNPHEPVRSEEILDGHIASWTEAHQQTEWAHDASASNMHNDGLYPPQHAHLDQAELVNNRHNGHLNNSLDGEVQPHESRQPTGKQHWLTRMLHIPPAKDH
jgi:hypothetical protein